MPMGCTSQPCVQFLLHKFSFPPFPPPPLQSLQTDAYDHYSAIYSLLTERLKKHKTLRVAPPTPRSISYPLNAVQVMYGLNISSDVCKGTVFSQLC